MNEIDGDFYCADNFLKKFANGTFCTSSYSKSCICLDNKCTLRHRKWPTPEQFREEYGREWPDDAPVHYLDDDHLNHAWELDLHVNAVDDERYLIVCASTPWGKPPGDWRPE